MLSITAVGSGGDYHAYLASEYYIDQAQAVRWAGRGAAELGLAGEVAGGDFAKVFDGFQVDGSPLVQNAGSSERQAAWDLTFSAPKDVSALWAVATDETREAVGRCHEEAVAEALDYLEGAAGRGRRNTLGAGGAKAVTAVTAKLVVAAYGHGASREQDPQLHTHCVVMNAGVRDDGTTGAILSRPLYQHKMTAGAVYRAGLAAALVRDLGLKLTADKHAFTIDGVPATLAKDWSKRREQIEQALGASHAHTAAAAAAATLATRRSKEPEPAGGLFTRWRTEGQTHGFTPEVAAALVGRVKAAIHGREQRVAQAVGQGAEKLLDKTSYVSEQQLIRQAAHDLRGGGAAGGEIREAVAHWLARPDVVAVGKLKGEARYTTKAIVERERQLLKDARDLSESKSHAVPGKALREARRKFPERGVSADDRERNRGQLAAVEHLLRPEALSVLSGRAGTGKSTVLSACREAWEQAGYRVTGVTLAGKAQKELTRASGIESETLAMRLAQLGREEGIAAAAWHHVKQVVKTAANELHGDVRLPIHRRGGFTLDAKTVVVLDEAGMVGTNEMAQLTQHVRRAGAKLVLVGDALQLQAISAGGPFARIERDVGGASLTHITRQRRDEADRLPEWRREAVSLLADGKSKEALSHYQSRGLLTVEANRAKAGERLVKDWVQHGGPSNPKNHLILAGTNEDVRALNALCQAERLKGVSVREKLKGVEVNGERFHEGDRVLFTKKDRGLQLDNGDLGTVVKVAGLGRSKTLAVTLDEGRTVEVPLAKYEQVRLGYAMTTHKAQGATVQHSYVLLGGSMQDLHLSYVQASRAREDTRFYADQHEAGPGHERIAKAMGQSRAKDMAHDLMDRGHQVGGHS